jgi:hypothetical protein
MYMRMVLRCQCANRKEKKKRKDYAFRRHFNEKPSIIRLPRAMCQYNKAQVWAASTWNLERMSKCFFMSVPRI